MSLQASTTTALAIMAGAACLGGCTHHIDVQPIRIEPIYVNVNVKVDRELDQFFDFENHAATQPAASAPAAPVDSSEPIPPPPSQPPSNSEGEATP